MRENLSWGPVLITSGPFKGRIGYYDEDEGSKAIVYFGHMFFATDYYLVPRRFLDEVNTEALLARHDAIWSAANAFKPGLSPKERLTLITELAYITDILWDRLLQARLQTAPSPRRIFVSHSSRDKGFAVSLAVDLGNSGHYVWLDEWEIRVGESIPTKINQGIEQSDVLIVVLSEHAVASHWVEREWQAKYWQEVDSGRIMVIPVLHRPCTVPALLRSKKYADFSEDYSKGLERYSLHSVCPGLGSQQIR